MSEVSMNRRNFLQAGTIAGAALAAAPFRANAAVQQWKWQKGKSPWALVLNASTVRPAPLENKVKVAAEAGFDGIELWVSELEEYEKAGHNLKDLGAKIKDLGLYVPNVIGLWDTMPPTEDEWQKILPTSRERMRMSAAVGSSHVAALPFPDRENFDTRWGTELYKRLMKIGKEEYNIIPGFEYIGFLKGVNRLGLACGMAIDADHPDACIVADTFHLFRGGSGFHGIRHLQGSFIASFHWNDVSQGLKPEDAGDKDRIYPGDGVLPLVPLLKDLAAIDYQGPLSVELFNGDYWKLPPPTIANNCIDRMRKQVAQALSEIAQSNGSSSETRGKGKHKKHPKSSNPLAL